MKIVIIGYSGYVKSTLAQKLSQHYAIPKLHLDTLQFLPGWVNRPIEAMRADVRHFLDQHDSWVIDGNYSQCFYEERMATADAIIWMNFPRLASLWRAFLRSQHYRGKTREDMAPDCPEKLDWEFVRWILWDGRRQSAKKRYAWIQETYSDKLVVLKSQKDIDSYLRGLEKPVG